MRGRIGVALLLMATAAWLVAESSAEAGHRRHRRGGCHTGCGYSAGCYTGCNTGCATAAPCASGCGAAVPATEAAPEPPAPPAPTPDAGANAPAANQPVVANATPRRSYSYATGSRPRRWFRR